MKPRVLLVSAEAVPLTKTGGLADVTTALAAALRAQNVDATILMPGYGPALEKALDLRRGSAAAATIPTSISTVASTKTMRCATPRSPMPPCRSVRA